MQPSVYDTVCLLMMFCWFFFWVLVKANLFVSIFEQTLVKRLDSKDWVMTCEALNNVRQLAIYHKERLQELL
jgi:hypothetical protein